MAPDAHDKMLSGFGLFEYLTMKTVPAFAVATFLRNANMLDENRYQEDKNLVE